jgi:hypothetical protein
MHREKRNARRKIKRSTPEWKNERARKRRERKRQDFKFNLHDKVSSAIRASLNGNKNGHGWESLVGYTLDDLKEHLEGLWSPGMNWENYGRYGWHIDHIIPISKFNFEKPVDIDFRRCWALSNLQPLWGKINYSKGAKIENDFQPSLTIEG